MLTVLNMMSTLFLTMDATPNAVLCILHFKKQTQHSEIKDFKNLLPVDGNNKAFAVPGTFQIQRPELTLCEMYNCIKICIVLKLNSRTVHVKAK